MFYKNLFFLLLLIISILILFYQQIITINYDRLNKIYQYTYVQSTNKICAFPNIRYNEEISLKMMDEDVVRMKSVYAQCEKEAKHVELLEILESNGIIARLNVSLIHRKLKVKKFECFLQRYDKLFNISKFERDFINYEKVFFKSELNYTIALGQHGYYYLKCFNKRDRLVFHNVYNVFPGDFAVLMEERKQYQVFEEDKRAKLKIVKEEPVVLDSKQEFDKKMNVLLIGIDSMSYNHFQRVLPRTYKYLNEELHNNVVFRQYSSIGFKTFYNLIPLLTGVVLSNIEPLKFKHEANIYNRNDNSYQDQMPYIWYDYEKLAGYFTAFQQDQPYWAFPNNLKRGFRFKPTSYYGRPFWLKYYRLKNSRRNCFNYKPLYKTYFDLIGTLLKRINDTQLPFFSLNYLTDYTHNTFSLPKQMDQDYYEMLKKFEDSGYYNNTLLIIFSDHGVRLHRFAIQTSIGKIERYLPFLSVRVPDALSKTDLYRNLVKNQDKLIGNFDLYQTLRHFLHININQTTALDNLQYRTNNYKIRHLRGISLFEKVPYDRSCGDALIPDAQCPCYQRTAIKQNEFESRTKVPFSIVGRLIIEAIETMTVKIKKLCVPYKLDRIESAKYLHSNGNEFYQFVAILQPGDAWFEALFDYKDNQLIVNGRITRLNAFGRQSICIKDDILRSYCYCKRHS